MAPYSGDGSVLLRTQRYSRLMEIQEWLPLLNPATHPCPRASARPARRCHSRSSFDPSHRPGAATGMLAVRAGDRDLVFSADDAEAAGPGDLLTSGECQLEESERLELVCALQRTGIDRGNAAGLDQRGEGGLGV